MRLRKCLKYKRKKNETTLEEVEEGIEEIFLRRSNRIPQISTRLRDFVTYKIHYPIQDFISYKNYITIQAYF
jgi:hypothetical protein